MLTTLFIKYYQQLSQLVIGGLKRYVTGILIKNSRKFKYSFYKHLLANVMIIFFLSIQCSVINIAYIGRDWNLQKRLKY